MLKNPEFTKYKKRVIQGVNMKIETTYEYAINFAIARAPDPMFSQRSCRFGVEGTAD